MIKALITDVSRVLLFPKDTIYARSLNELHKNESSKSNYQFFDMFELNEELLNFYKSLRDSLKVYILTSDVIQDDPALQPFWNGTIDKIFSASKMNTHKSKPEAYEKVLQELGLNPQEVLYIDDSNENLNAAKSVGLQTVLYKDNEQTFIDLRKNLEVVSTSWVTPKAQIRNIPNKDKGMFAIEQIKKGEKVVVWRGEYTNKEGAEKAKLEGKLTMQWDDDLYSIEDRGDDIGYYINHSCDPNLWMQDAYTLEARRDIEADEELTADYAMWEADENYISKWECSCGSDTCRKKITGKDWRLEELQERYKDHFSPLINKRINNQ